MIIEIEATSGFCFGVERAVEAAEKALDGGAEVYCLGEIVHNRQEVQRLSEKGLKQITHDQLTSLAGKKVMIRAHGEPPETYQTIRESDTQLIDATCPVVLKLQKRVKKALEENPGAQMVIYGKPGHPEVVSLSGQIGHKAIVVTGDYKSLEAIDFQKPVVLFSQTTQSLEGFHDLIKELEGRLKKYHSDLSGAFTVNDTICRQVSRRGPAIKMFAQSHDVIIFVSGANSSNGRYLYGLCKEVNPASHFVEQAGKLKKEWFEDARSTGITGATSTPRWQMEDVARAIKKL